MFVFINLKAYLCFPFLMILLNFEKHSKDERGAGQGQQNGACFASSGHGRLKDRKMCLRLVGGWFCEWAKGIDEVGGRDEEERKSGDDDVARVDGVY